MLDAEVGGERKEEGRIKWTKRERIDYDDVGSYSSMAWVDK